MFTRSLKTKNKLPIGSKDELIRFIMSYDFDMTVGAIKDSAFQTKYLETGLSVSIKKILDSITKQHVIAQLENGGVHQYICDCEALVYKIKQILKGNQIQVFEIKYTPDSVNKAHCDIIFSSGVGQLGKAEKKQYKQELMKVFGL